MFQLREREKEFAPMAFKPCDNSNANDLQTKLSTILHIIKSLRKFFGNHVQSLRTHTHTIIYINLNSVPAIHSSFKFKFDYQIYICCSRSFATHSLVNESVAPAFYRLNEFNSKCSKQLRVKIYHLLKITNNHKV